MRKPNGAKLASYFSLGLTVFAVLALTVAFAAPASFAQEATATSEPAGVGNSKWQLEAVSADDVVNMNEPAAYIVQFEAPAVATYRGGINGLAATNPAATGSVRLQNTPAVQAYVAYLKVEQDKFVKAAEVELSRAVDVNFTYQHAFNGMSVTVTPAEATQIAQMAGVRSVVRSETHELLTDVGPAWIGAPSIWDGSDVPSGVGTYGEGVVVAILDTGINSLHPSFAVTDSYGYTHTNPLGSGTYLGVCDPTNPDYQDTFVCNDKLIGAHDFIDGTGNDPDSPEDGDGHGSHTASTVAGNFVVDAVLEGPTAAITATISGVAPHANIIAYDVCRNGPSETGGGCPGDALLAAVNQVVADSTDLPNGVAAINYSISGGTSPYSDPVELAFLAATDAGIFVSASAGNSGPTAATVAHVSPWVSTVAASTHNRAIFNNAVDFTSDGGSLGDMTGLGFAPGYGPAPLLYAGNFGDALCLNAFAPGTFTGQIVICDRGTNARVDKGANVLAGGAGGMILADNGAGLVGDAHFLPAVHISQADGAALKAWVAANTNPQGRITGYIANYDASNGDIMAGFSSRGPVTAFGVLKPDVTAPGVDIWAAVQDNGEGGPDYGFLSGTSMSSPHNAGAAALMAALYPTWTPHQIKSAMMLTADNVDNFKENGTTPATPFDLGAGRIQVAVAANAGFVLNETTENFEDADPALNNGQEAALQQLNIASMANKNCVGACEWTRTIQSVLPVAATYTVTFSAPAGITVTVTPDVFTLAAGGTQELTIEADVTGAAVGAWQFASIQFETDATRPASPVELLSEEFTGETFPPTGWSTHKLSGAGTAVWARVTNQFSTPPASARRTFGGSTDGFQDDWLVTPAITLTAPSVLSFIDAGQWMGDYVYSGVLASTGSCNPADNAFVEVAEIDDTPGAAGTITWRATPKVVDLSAYTGDTVCLAFRYSGNFAHAWWVDDVTIASVSQADVPSVSMPIAVVPSVGNLPSEVSVETARDASSYTLNDLQALEITDAQVMFYGPALATNYEFMLAQDPTTGNPYDNLDDVFWTTVDVPADTARLVAEILATTSPDLDLFWGSGSMPSAGTELGSSATGATLEYLTTNNPPAGTYWVLVQNWAASAAVVDSGTLAVGVVPMTDAGTATFDMPTSQPAGVSFSATLFWDFPESSEGDAVYGAMVLGTDASEADNLGVVDVNIYRTADDVSKSASAEYAMPGDVVTYTINIAQNPFDVVLGYNLTDTIPAGMTYVGGSLSASSGTANISGDTITWSGDLLPSAGLIYAMSDNSTSASCAVPFGAGTYVNLQGFGLLTDAGLSGNNINWQYTGRAIDFYDQLAVAPRFTDDGYVTFDTNFSASNQDIPDTTVPNNLMALLWRDFVIVHDATLNHGVTSATASSGALQIVEFDDIQVNGDSSQTLDMQIVNLRNPNLLPGNVDIAFAYTNVNLSSNTGTVGVENPDGTKATSYGFDDVVISDGLIICFDLLPQLANPVVITYAATVDADVELGTAVTNVVAHENDFLGTRVEESDAMVTVGSGEAELRVAHFAPFASDAAGDGFAVSAGTAVSVTLNGSTVLTNVLFGDATTYLTVPAGTHMVGVELPDGTPVIEESVSLTTDRQYAAVAIGGANGHMPELLALMDDNTPPAEGMGHVRFGHLAPFTAVMTDTLADIRTDAGDLVLGPVPYGAVATYMPLAAGEYDLQVTTPGGAEVIIDLLPFTLNAGDILDVFVVGDGINQQVNVVAVTTDGESATLPQAVRGVELHAANVAITGTVGTVVTYTVHITNTGNTTDTFDISATGTWTTTAPATVELGAGEMGMFYVWVEIAADAEAGASDMTTVMATSQGDDTMMDSVMLTTTAEAAPVTGFKLYLPLVSKP